MKSVSFSGINVCGQTNQRSNIQHHSAIPGTRQCPKKVISVDRRPSINSTDPRQLNLEQYLKRDKTNIPSDNNTKVDDVDEVKVEDGANERKSAHNVKFPSKLTANSSYKSVSLPHQCHLLSSQLKIPHRDKNQVQVNQN